MLMSVCGQKCSTLAASICSLHHFVRWRLGMQSAQLGSTGNTDEPARHLCPDRNVLLKERRTMAFIPVIDDHETSLDALATIIRSGGTILHLRVRLVGEDAVEQTRCVWAD